MRMPFKKPAISGLGPGTSTAGTLPSVSMTGSAINHHMPSSNVQTGTTAATTAHKRNSTSPRASSTSSYLAKLKFSAKQTTKLPDN